MATKVASSVKHADKKQGRYRSLEDAIQQKQEVILKILAGVDLSRFISSDDSSINSGDEQGQST